MIDLLVVSHACFMGINRGVYRLFKESGWNIEIIAPQTLQFPNGLRQAELAREDDPPIHFLELKGTNPRTYSFEGLKRLLDQKKPAIVLLDNDPVSRMAIDIGKWCTIHQAQLYCISCENMPLDIASTLKRRGIKGLASAFLKRILLKLSKKRVAGVFCINSDGERIFKAEGFQNVVRMPLGYDPEYFYPDTVKREEIRKELGLTYPVIAYFGRLTPEKGVHVLIGALSGLMDLNWQLMMDDFDEYSTAYTLDIKQLLDTSGIRDRVVFISPSHYEIAGYMNAADIVVLPSVSTPVWKEQYGRVVPEAFACGKDVVVTDCGSLPELSDKHGIIFPQGNSTSLKGIIKELLINGEQNNSGSNEASRYAMKNLSIQKQKEVMQNNLDYSYSGNNIST